MILYKVIPARPTFAAGMTETEPAIMSRHVAYQTDLLDKDVAVAFGPVAGPSGLYGMAVVEAPDEQQVRILAENDLAISTGRLPMRCSPCRRPWPAASPPPRRQRQDPG